MFLSVLSIWLFYIVQFVWGETFNPRPLRHHFSTHVVKEAWVRARDIISERRRSFHSRVRPAGLQESIAVDLHERFQSSEPRSRRLEKIQERFEESTRVLQEGFNLKPEEIKFGLAETDLKSILEGNEVDTCEAQVNVSFCHPNNKYRTLDGTCNNLIHPSWGMAGSCFERLVEPDYADGIADRRVAMSRNPLPSSRRISLEIHSHYDNPNHYITHMFMVWGQFLDHDISLTPQSQGPDQEFLECCPVSDDDPSACDPIILSNDDPFFRKFNITCLSNVRSAICLTCSLGPRQQINQLTAYIDASHIYSLNQNQSRGLRNNDGTGTLKSQNLHVAGELLPKSFSPNDDFCSFQDPELDCFQTGDQRSNQHPALTSLHTLFLREHNRLARRLREINPRWSDDTVFEEARRIVGAEMQVITYKEYLPLVLGPERMEWFDLSILRNDQFTEYDETVPATLLNEFSTAAFRFGHSTINSFFPDSRGNNHGFYLRDRFDYPFGLYRGQLEGIVGGLTMSPSQKFDRYMVRDVTNHMYQIRGSKTGLDLASLNIQRGRDHGIPGYTTLVEFCGGPQIRTWRDLDRLFQRGLRTLFQKLYERVEDIDLFSGGLAERPNQGAVVGPTFACILGIQFYRLKYGDRFYFEHGGQAGSFTPSQLRELREVTLSNIICDNLRIDEMTENAFLRQGSRNMMELCSKKAGMNLKAWRVKNKLKSKN